MQESTTTERGPVRFPPPLIYISGLLLGWLAETMWPTLTVPRWLGLIALVASLIVFFRLDTPAMAGFKRAGTSPFPWRPVSALVTDGPYSFTRNPMYLAMAVLYTGIALAFSILWALALLPVVIAIVSVAVIGREERYLEARYGDEYVTYKQRVRRWI